MHGVDSKIAQVKALRKKKGIQNLLDAAYEILGNPIAMFDTEYNLQAYTNVVTDDPIWVELIAQGNFSYETQVLFAEEGFVHASANTKTTAVLISDKLKYDRILGKIYNKDNLHVANLILVASNKPLEENDAEILKGVCAVFSKEIFKSEFYRTYGKMYQENYIRKLLDGQIEEKLLYAAHIAIIYNGFAGCMRLVVANIGKGVHEYLKLAYFRDLFIETQGGFEYAIYENYILIIISSNNINFNAERDLKKLYAKFEEHNIYAGVSSRFDNMFELRQYYNEAVNALKYVLKDNGEAHIYSYDAIERGL